jgi:hypothetical protein
MPDEQKDVAEKVLAGITAGRETGKCETCGHNGKDNDLFNCESCGKPICTNCHNMTMDCEIICQDCIKARGLTPDDLML